MIFINDLQAYKKQRLDTIQRKKDSLEQLKTEYQNKLEQIKASEQEYQVNFEEKVFDYLTVLKQELNKIKSNMDKVQTQVDLMNIGQLKLDNDEITKQITDYVDSMRLDKLKENILIAKQKYLDSIKKFRTTTEEIEATRSEIDNLSEVIDQENKKPIARAFYGKRESYYLNKEYLGIDLSSVAGGIESQGYNIGKVFEGTNGY